MEKKPRYYTYFSIEFGKIFFFSTERSFIWSLIMSTMYGKSTHSAERFPALDGALKEDKKYNFAITTIYVEISKTKTKFLELFSLIHMLPQGLCLKNVNNHSSNCTFLKDFRPF